MPNVLPSGDRFQDRDSCAITSKRPVGQETLSLRAVGFHLTMRDRRVSVAMATYMGQRFLSDQLNSIASQTRLPDELVVSDDQSTDGTLEIASEFAERAPFPVRIVRNESSLRGVIGNFFNAFAHCDGDVIAYCDQDDVWAPEKLNICLAKFADPNVSLVIHRSRITDELLNDSGRVMSDRKGDLTVRWPSFPISNWGFGHQMLFDTGVLPIMVALHRRLKPELSSIVGTFDRLIPIAAGMKGHVSYLANELVYFRRHSGSTSPAGKATHQSRFSERVMNKRNSISGIARDLRALKELTVGQSPLDGTLGAAASGYLTYVSRLASHFEARTRIYDGKTKADRVVELVKTWYQGTYRAESAGGCGSGALLHDLAASLVNA